MRLAKAAITLGVSIPTIRRGLDDPHSGIQFTLTPSGHYDIEERSLLNWNERRLTEKPRRRMAELAA
jgi:hypothetical protein